MEKQSYLGVCKVESNPSNICSHCEYCISSPESFAIVGSTGKGTEIVNVDGVCKKGSCRIIPNKWYNIVNIGEKFVILEDEIEKKLFKVPIESVYEVSLD